MDWAFARNFICGSCGERDLEYRTEVATVKMRCMHCATDHEVDMREAVAVPLITEV
jgi:formylmethanofuran dehydrogenase subunit E